MISTPNCHIMHIPKTGGLYVKNLLHANGIKLSIKYVFIVNSPSTFANEIIDSRMDEMYQLPKKPTDGNPVVMVVRNPAFWYMGYFINRNNHALGLTGGWSAYRDFDRKCMSSDFHTFMQKVFFAYPAGFLGQLYSIYEYICKPTHIIHTESLFIELAPLIKRYCGVTLKDIDMEAVPQPPKEMTPKMADRIRNYESEIIEKYYKETGC